MDEIVKVLHGRGDLKVIASAYKESCVIQVVLKLWSRLWIKDDQEVLLFSEEGSISRAT